MRKSGYASWQDRKSHVLQRIHKVLASGLISEAPDELVTPLLEAAVDLVRARSPSRAAFDRAQTAVTQIERWNADRPDPEYKPNDYARSWMRIVSSIAHDR